MNSRLATAIAVIILTAASSLTIGAPAAHAVVLFSQDFSDGGPVSSYLGTGPGLWNAFNCTGVSVGIIDNALAYTRTTGAGSFTRTTDLSPTAPDVLIYKLTLNVTGNTASGTSAATWQVGSDFQSYAASPEANARIHSRFGINLTGSPYFPNTYQFIDQMGGSPSREFTGSQSLTWVINNSGKTFSYEAPNHNWETVGNDHWDLWAGNSKVFNDVMAQSPDRQLTDLKFVFNNGNGTITMDNFEISTVPEPRWTASVAAGLVLVLVIGRRLSMRSTVRS